MTNEERDIQRKLKVLQHAEKIGNARKACRYFGIGRSSFYRWRDAYQKHGEAGLKNIKSIPKNPANQTPPEIVEKILYLRRKYHLGPIRIVWYLARYETEVLRTYVTEQEHIAKISHQPLICSRPGTFGLVSIR